MHVRTFLLKSRERGEIDKEEIFLLLRRFEKEGRTAATPIIDDGWL